jgi:hypothetical protein
MKSILKEACVECDGCSWIAAEIQVRYNITGTVTFTTTTTLIISFIVIIIPCGVEEIPV